MSVMIIRDANSRLLNLVFLSFLNTRARYCRGKACIETTPRRIPGKPGILAPLTHLAGKSGRAQARP